MYRRSWKLSRYFSKEFSQSNPGKWLLPRTNKSRKNDRKNK